MSITGAKIAKKINAAGVTKTEFAERLGVTNKHLSSLLVGRSLPSAELCTKLEEVTGTSRTTWWKTVGEDKWAELDS